MKTICTLITLLLFYCSIVVFGQSVDYKQKYSPTELRADIDSMIKYIEEVHINPYYKYPKTKFYKEADSIKASLVKPLSPTDFFFIAQRLVAKLEDGHTNLQGPFEEFYKPDTLVFPYQVHLSPEPPYITIEDSLPNLKNEIPYHAQISSINGISSKQIIEDLLKLNSGESPVFRLVRAQDVFPFYLATFYKMHDRFTMNYRNGPSQKVVDIPSVELNSLKEQEKHKEKSSHYSLKILPDQKVAIIDFRDFVNRDKFKMFIDSTFQLLQKEGIQNLIIDIRNNGGGDSTIGDEFFQYLAQEPFRQYSKVLIKYSKPQKKMYRWYYENLRDSLFLSYLNKQNGLVELDPQESEMVKLRNNPSKFTGQVYLLTSEFTFSSAADFAQCFKHYKMGKIIGKETGGWIVSYGDIIPVRLPNTRLILIISHKLFYNVGTNEDDFHGVIPDIEVDSDKALDYTLKLISSH